VTLRERWYTFRLNVMLQGGLVGWCRWRRRLYQTRYVVADPATNALMVFRTEPAMWEWLAEHSVRSYEMGHGKMNGYPVVIRRRVEEWSRPGAN
jgi:hypothetical protein